MSTRLGGIGVDLVEDGSCSQPLLFGHNQFLHHFSGIGGHNGAAQHFAIAGLPAAFFQEEDETPITVIRGNGPVITFQFKIHHFIRETALFHFFLAEAKSGYLGIGKRAPTEIVQIELLLKGPGYKKIIE